MEFLRLFLKTSGVYAESVGIGPELVQNRYVIPAPHPRITVRGKLCAGRESNTTLRSSSLRSTSQPRINVVTAAAKTAHQATGPPEQRSP